MQSDIVQRLRAASQGMRSHYKVGAVELIPTHTMDEAAAEIASLTEALREADENINLKADFIDATINQLAAKDQDIYELKEALRAAEEREKGLREEREELLSQISDCRGSHWLGRQDRKGVAPHLDAIWRGLVEIDDARAALKEQPHAGA